MLPPFGAILFDPSAPFFTLGGPQPVPFQLVVNVPAGLAAPTVLYVQAAGFDAATGFGNFSNRLIVAIQ